MDTVTLARRRPFGGALKKVLPVTTAARPA